MDLKLVAILFVTTVLAWWLSGYDTNVTGENKASDLRRRIIRCGISALLVAAGVGGSMGGANFGGFIFIAVALPLAVLWAGCLSELFARAAHSLIDSPDPTPCDPGKVARDLDKLAVLVQQGRNEEAIKLCTTLLQSRESSVLAMDTVLARVYDQMFSEERLLTLPVSGEADRLFQEGRTADAESLLSQLVRREPRNLAAVFCLLRLYARDLRCSEKAKALLETLSQRSDWPPGFAAHAHQRIDDWLTPARREEKSDEGIESLLVEKRTSSKAPGQSVTTTPTSVSELLTAGHLGTAIEILEKNLAERPQDFDLWLTLAEAHGVYCRNLERASKIVGKMEASGLFTPQQMQTAHAKLNEWRTGRAKSVGI